jgi:serine protease Do
MFRNNRVLTSFIIILLAIATTGVAQTTPKSASATQNPKAAEKAATFTSELGKAAVPEKSDAPAILQQLNSALQSVVAKVSPAVVQIQVTGYGPVEENNASETALIARQQAIGSGVIVDSNGYIVTNSHVVQGAQRIRVLLTMPTTDHPELEATARQRVVEAKLIGMHKETDLALLKIEATGLPTLELGSARHIRQGQLVFAIGSPQGLQNSVTMGVVSSVGRQPDPDRPMVYIQTDAPINPGNSGGPLVDMDGRVLGINTMIFTQSGGSEGLGFAIPARVVNFVYQSLRKHGHVHRVEIGAGAQNITADLAEGLGLSQNYGVIVSDLKPGGPAEAAGLMIGDIILSADDRLINTLPELTAVMYLHPLDEVMKVVVLRGKQRVSLEIPVIEYRDAMDKAVDSVDPDKSLVAPLAILAVDLTSEIQSAIGNLRISGGVVVIGRAANLIGPDTGLRTGDVIHSLNNKPVDSVDTLRNLLQQFKPGAPIVMQVERENGLQWVSFEMG